MESKSLGQSLVEDTAAKGALFGPALAGAVALGPLGFAAGLIFSIIMLASGNDKPAPPQPLTS